MFNADNKLKIHWEITDLCNCKCPMCPRTDISDHCRPVKEIENSQFSLDDVKRLLPDSFLKKIKRIDFCGNYGDPCIAQDFYEICEFLVKDYGITIMASTNGSMRNPTWWKKLGELLATTDSWFEFHIDGLEDTNHFYRIGANWQKVMANTKAFIASGTRADWNYIVFKHNEHQLAQAQELAQAMGFMHFVTTDSGRFPKDGKFRFMHPDGTIRTLEPATNSEHHRNKNTPPATLHASPSNKPTAMSTINCKSASKNRLYLDSLGNITPCCWVSSRDVTNPGDMLKSLAIAGKDLADFNIRNRPIDEILSDELFTDIFPKLWGSDQLATCRKKCGKKHRNIKQQIEL